jgi:tetratricopeptide (TPR) repeat protein
VFLASQHSLADRPVVLKVTPRGREEHLSLARLQHMHIVPLYSEHVLQARRLQILCMPFLGGATLEQVLRLLETYPPQDRSGKQIIDALDRIKQPLPIVSAAQGPFRGYLTRSSYVVAVCSIGACLADGLQYAHERGLVHMDIKPSNVLLADDGQPMLLDFHLARGPICSHGPPPAWIGGTPAYMAPEQQEAVTCLRAGRAISIGVDHRADLYALGKLLHEALGGSRSESSTAEPPPLCFINPRVSMGLSDIIQKCLRRDPRERYPDSAALATDLRCHLADLPLRGVPNRSALEAWRKWRRRKPYALWRTAFLVAAIGATVVAGALMWPAYRQRVAEIRTALADGRATMRRRQYSEAVRILRRGMALAAYLPGVGELRQQLAERLTVATRREKAAELHELAESIRFRYALAQPPPEEAKRLIARGHEIWRARRALAQGERSQELPEFELNIKRDMLDFVKIWTDLQVQLAPPEQHGAAREACLGILAEAEAEYGGSRLLDSARQNLEGTPRRPGADPGPGTQPRSHWDDYELGTSYLQAGQFNLAAEQFRRGLDLRPQDFWLNFYHGLCAFRTGKFAEAAHAFHICIALSPETAECYYNRGRAYQELGETRMAMHDYARALELNPRLCDAVLNRAIILHQQGHQNEAAMALEQALGMAPGPASLGEIHYIWALVELKREKRAKALEHLKAASEQGHSRAHDLRERLLSRP